MVSAGLWRSTVAGYKVSKQIQCAAFSSRFFKKSGVSGLHVFNSFILVQERLTKQIATAISEALQPKGVAVVIEAA